MEPKNLVIGKLYKLENYKGCYYIGNSDIGPRIFLVKKEQKHFMYLGQGKESFSGFFWFLDNNSQSCYIIAGASKSSGTASFLVKIKELNV